MEVYEAVSRADVEEFWYEWYWWEWMRNKK
jgi:hypothetical protein